MKFVRTPEYMQKMFIEALDSKNVIQDAKIYIQTDWDKQGKLRAMYVHRTGNDHMNYWVQFPNALRKYDAVYIADVIEVKSDKRGTFYRVMKGSIRKEGSNEVVG